MPAEITTAGTRTGVRLFISICRYIVAAAAILLLVTLTVNAANAFAAAESDIAPYIERELRDHPPELRAFYADRGFRAIWNDPKRRTELQTLEQLALIHGLEPTNYSLVWLENQAALLDERSKAQSLAAMDVRASAAILKLAAHLRDGAVDMASWRYAAPRPDEQLWDAGRELLAAAVDSESLFAYLNGLAPDSEVYRALQLALMDYRAMQAREQSWHKIADGPALEIGIAGPRVVQLRERLGQTDSSAAANEVYDQALAEAVTDFQARHLLTPDGIADALTIEALNVSLTERLNQIVVNLEWQRWAAMPEDSEYLLVNVPQFRIYWVEQGERTWSTRIQVGRYKRQTPVFKSELTKVVANPTWTIPPTIFREDVLPQVQSDPDYLARNGMRVIDKSGKTVDSSDFDWKSISAVDFPYRLRAFPGATNALGRLKFEMPNPYFIYLHDTPSRDLFADDLRAFSSGCIRLENPEQLARRLMVREADAAVARLDRALSAERTRHLELGDPIPVVVMYGTVDIDANGELVFARDVYGRDSAVLMAMHSSQPDDRDTIMLAQLSAGTD